MRTNVGGPASPRGNHPGLCGGVTTLPSPAATWVAAALGAPLPTERRAACDACPMCGPEAELRELVSFDPETRCCTWQPPLHNFLAGGVLGEVSAGAERVAERIAERRGAVPAGLLQPPALRANAHKHESVFGRDRSLLCAYFDDGRCTVWAHRESTCATWFCKHERGAAGKRFWRSVHALLGEIETALSRWCVRTLDPGEDAVALNVDPRALLSVAGPVEVLPEPLYRRLWGSWAGREVSFYRACAERVAALGWADIVAIGGPAVEQVAWEARHALAATAPGPLPERYGPGPVRVRETERGTVVVGGYSAYDPVELPAETWHALWEPSPELPEELLRLLLERAIVLPR